MLPYLTIPFQARQHTTDAPMKDPLTRLLSLLLVASVACARPTPAHPGASASPDAVKMPAILLDVPASPVPGRPLAYDSVEAAGTALAVVLTAPSALHPTPSEDSIRQPGTEVVTHPSDLRLNLNNPAPTAVPAHHAQFIADAVDAPAVFSNTVRDGYQVAVRAVVGRRGTVDVHVATAGTGTPDSPLIAKHPTLPKMIGYSIILLGTSTACARSSDATDIPFRLSVQLRCSSSYISSFRRSVLRSLRFGRVGDAPCSVRRYPSPSPPSSAHASSRFRNTA